MRLFIAIPTPPHAEILGCLEELAEAARTCVGLQVVPADNLHITLKFLGEVGSDQVPQIVTAMDRALAGQHGFDLALGRAGSFPGALWLQAKAAELAAMAQRLEQELAVLGFEPEKRNYCPHLTLARLKPHSDFELQTWLQQHRQQQLLQYSAAAVHLYQSVPVAGGVRYQSLHCLRLSDTGV